MKRTAGEDLDKVASSPAPGAAEQVVDDKLGDDELLAALLLLLLLLAVDEEEEGAAAEVFVECPRHNLPPFKIPVRGGSGKGVTPCVPDEDVEDELEPPACCPEVPSSSTCCCCCCC